MLILMLLLKNLSIILKILKKNQKLKKLLSLNNNKLFIESKKIHLNNLIFLLEIFLLKNKIIIKIFKVLDNSKKIIIFSLFSNRILINLNHRVYNTIIMLIKIIKKVIPKILININKKSLHFYSL